MYKRRRTYLPTYLPVCALLWNLTSVYTTSFGKSETQGTGYIPVCLSRADVRARLTSRSLFHVGKSVPDPRRLFFYAARASPPVIVRPAMMNGRKGTPDSQDKDWLYRRRAKLSCCPAFHGRWRDILAVVWLKRVESIGRTTRETFLSRGGLSFFFFFRSRHKEFVARACFAHLSLIARPRE